MLARQSPAEVDETGSQIEANVKNSVSVVEAKSYNDSVLFHLLQQRLAGPEASSHRLVEAHKCVGRTCLGAICRVRHSKPRTDSVLEQQPKKVNAALAFSRNTSRLGWCPSFSAASFREGNTCSFAHSSAVGRSAQALG